MMLHRLTDRRLFAPEVVQTSSMDCGPAALKCMLEGYGISVSFGRLREACQTDIDGTSIDAIESTAGALGLSVEQCMLPADHLFLRSSPAIPALLITQQADGSNHFVVLWRKHGHFLQVMDPALGRRFVPENHFLDDLLRHDVSIAAREWRAWAETPEFIVALQERLTLIGVPHSQIAEFLAETKKDEGWFSFGALDAATRLTSRLVDGGGVACGPEASRLLKNFLTQTLAKTRDIFADIPAEYWSVSPDTANQAHEELHLRMHGAVLLRITGKKAEPSGVRHKSELNSIELRAALAETPVKPLQAMWASLRDSCNFKPAWIAGALVVAVLGTLTEALLFRALFDIGSQLALGEQRMAASLALIGFLSLVLVFRMQLASEALRIGRQLDGWMRAKIMAKLPRLGDHYFRSRPISDLADRAHSIHMLRGAPALAMQFLQSVMELALIILGIAFIDPVSVTIAEGIVLSVIGGPIVFQPLINERDLRMRSQAGALSRFYLDALVGLMPIRAHRAEKQVRRQHESLLVEWARSSLSTMRAGLWASGAQSIVTGLLAGFLLIEHFMRMTAVTGADLLLVYWTMRLPAIGGQITDIAHQYPAQRNIFLRLSEPLMAPESGSHELSKNPSAGKNCEKGMAIAITAGAVVAGGHTILGSVNIVIRPGEHIAVVGLSGAGKSSLLGLMLGWHRLSTGSIEIDGAAFTEEQLPALRRDIAWIDPAVQIMNAPFLDNIMYASPDENVANVSASVRKADLRHVLQRLPNGLQSALGESGGKLSGGEGQRIRLARAFMQDGVRLALLDEPFRGLDRTQRQSLLDTVRNHWQSATLLCVTHDIAETQSFDRVLVIHNGEIIEDGTPAALAAGDTHYARLLEAERMVQQRLWENQNWQRILIEDGRVRCTV